MNILLTFAGCRTYMIEYFKQVLNGTGKVFASNNGQEYYNTKRRSQKS